MQNNVEEELKPLKLEQPYSVIRQRNMDDDPNKLGSWERSPHNSSKITKENLNDAVAVRNAFKNVYDDDNSNSMLAPEGNNNDYFLKAKNNLVSKTNNRKIGSFLNQFHGMDFFKRGVPEIEKGLKGTGYDMGPSANIVDNLKEAVDKGDTKEVENIIEEHPEESQEALPEDTPIQEEAEQITEDTNKANDEVNNEVVEDFVKENDQFKGIDEETLKAKAEEEKKRRDEAWAKLMATDKKSTEKKSEKKSGDIDWDKVKVYEPGEDPYPKVSDESDWANNPEYEPSEDADVYLHHDEDFAGPDELPATIDQIRDEDFVGPDEQLAEYNGGLPAENQYEPVYDTSDYNFDWDAVIETLPPDLREDMESLPEDDKDEISKLLHINMGKVKSNGISVPSSSGGNANPDIDMGTTRGGRGSIGGNMLGRSLGGMGGIAGARSVSGGKPSIQSMDTIRSVASKGPIPPKVNESNGSIASGGSNNSRTHSNGTFGSGPGMLFDKGVGDIKTVSTAPVVPVSEREESKDENRISSPEDVKEAMIESLESKIAQLSEDEMEALGIAHKYKHFDWNGIPLDELSGAQINELGSIVDKALRN